MKKLFSINPADGKKVGQVLISQKKDIQKAVQKAKEAFIKWREVPLEKKISYIKKYKKLIYSYKDKLAELATLEMGKPLKQSYSDIEDDQKHFDYWIEKGPQILKNKLILEDKEGKSYLIREPYGVCAVITPWNYPFGNALLGIVPAILSGNTVVFKHSEYTPLCGKIIVELLWETGIPDGVVNIIYGAEEVGRMLIDAPIDFVWFTGSTKAGREIYVKCAQKFIRCLLELGGSSPAIVFKDVNIDKVIKEIYNARFGNCGQVCTAVKRLFLEKGICEDFTQKLVSYIKGKKVGNPFDKDTDIGPLVSEKQLNLLESQVQDALKKGAKVEIGGKRLTNGIFKKGYFFEPTILTNIKPNMKVINEEVFGPVLPIVEFNSVKEAIKMANNTAYGLSAEIFTNNLRLAKSLIGKIDAGTIAINTDNFFRPECPFGGYKKSGIGRGSGEFIFYEYTQVKHVRIAQ